MQFKHLLLPALVATSAQAGPIVGILAYSVCQAGCSKVVVACYIAGGAVFGTVAAVLAPVAIAGCNVAYGACYAGCASITLAPTP